MLQVNITSNIEVKCLYSWYNLPKCTYFVQIYKSDPVSFWRRGLNIWDWEIRFLQQNQGYRPHNLYTSLPVEWKNKKKVYTSNCLNLEEKLPNSSISGNLSDKVLNHQQCWSRATNRKPATFYSGYCTFSIFQNGRNLRESKRWVPESRQN